MELVGLGVEVEQLVVAIRPLRLDAPIWRDLPDAVINVRDSRGRGSGATSPENLGDLHAFGDRRLSELERDQAVPLRLQRCESSHGRQGELNGLGQFSLRKSAAIG